MQRDTFVIVLASDATATRIIYKISMYIKGTFAAYAIHLYLFNIDIISP